MNMFLLSIRGQCYKYTTPLKVHGNLRKYKLFQIKSGRGYVVILGFPGEVLCNIFFLRSVLAKYENEAELKRGKIEGHQRVKAGFDPETFMAVKHLSQTDTF